MCDGGEIQRLRAALAVYADERNWPRHRQLEAYPARRGGYLSEVFQPAGVHPPNRHGWEIAAAALGLVPESTVEA